MDTVIGSIGGKAILTFDLTVCNFMFGILLENKTSAEVSRAIKRLKSRLLELGSTFGEIFPLILTDNGGEFADVFSIENTSQGERETRLYFCDPYQSSQKPHVEKNHTLFRDIVPQGSSFDDFTQDTVDLIFSHVNAIKRRRFRGKSPFEHFAFLYNPSIISALGIRSIAECEVCQSPALLKR
jgi:IS30 family transposase